MNPPAASPISVLASAKLNLGLRVLGRRPDGYHQLESLFVPLDLADRIRIDWDETPGVAAVVEFELERCKGATGAPGGSANLAARAARAFLESAGLQARVGIRLEKRIPVGAGLGGGSSDAAAVLRGLAQIFPGRLTSAQQTHLARHLGADVPYFLAPEPALVSGVGEVLQPVQGLPQLTFALVHPGISLATAAVYTAFDALPPALTRARPAPTLRALLGLRGEENRIDEVRIDTFWDGLQALLANDLEPAARRLCPPIAGLYDRLQCAGARAVGMTGSGATVYGVFEDVAAAESALATAAFDSPVWSSTARSLGGRGAIALRADDCG